jgi:ribosomal-protein-alanine N-acetyltransferase
MLRFSLPSFPELETDRLVLRAHLIEDANAIYAMRTNEDVMRYIDRERPENIQAARDFIQTLNEGYTRGMNLAWAMAIKDEPQKLIGSIGYWRTDMANHRAEIGYMLMPQYWRKGLVAEALMKTITFGFETVNLHTICAHINPENDASRQILIKHGFEKEAYLKEAYHFKGKFMDSEIYGIINPNH